MDKSTLEVGQNEIYDLFEIRRKALVNFEYASSLTSTRAFWNFLNNLALYHALIKNYTDEPEEIDKEIKKMRSDWFNLNMNNPDNVYNFFIRLQALFEKIEKARFQAGISMTVEKERLIDRD